MKNRAFWVQEILTAHTTLGQELSLGWLEGRLEKAWSQPPGVRLGFDVAVNPLSARDHWGRDQQFQVLLKTVESLCNTKGYALLKKIKPALEVPGMEAGMHRFARQVI
jgi:hypothetical protein